jgi:hypothetical protein
MSDTVHSNQLSISDRAMEDNNNISLDKQPTTKTLGVIWHCDSDTIKYSIHLKPNQSKTITKREILSVIARIFDPLGLVGPATISGKIIMQKLWATKLNWDESLPIELHTTWNHFLKISMLSVTYEYRDLSFPIKTISKFTGFVTLANASSVTEC